MSKAEGPHRTEEVREVLEELVKQSVLQKRTVNGVRRYQVTPENELTPELACCAWNWTCNAAQQA